MQKIHVKWTSVRRAKCIGSNAKIHDFGGVVKCDAKYGHAENELEVNLTWRAKCMVSQRKIMFSLVLRCDGKPRCAEN